MTDEEIYEKQLEFWTKIVKDLRKDMEDFKNKRLEDKNNE